ncbi:MAG: 50S ribosomal protein L20 [Elusimicrobiota bacterium]
MRIKYSVARNRRKKRIFKLAKGFYGDKSRRLRMATQQVKKSLTRAFIDRRKKKRDMRSLWIVRLNAAVREFGISYSKFIGGLKKANIELNKKMLSEIAINDPNSFKALVDIAKKNISSN